MTAKRSRMMKSKIPRRKSKGHRKLCLSSLYGKLKHPPSPEAIRRALAFQAPDDWVPDPDGLTPIRRSEWIARNRRLRKPGKG